MKISRFFYFVLILFAINLPSLSKELILSGNQEAVVEYQLVQQITPFAGIEQLIVTFVQPQDFISLTYRQEISEVKFNFTIPPNSEETTQDDRGNNLKTFSWNNPQKTIICSLNLKAKNTVQFVVLEREAPFPLQNLPPEIAGFLQSTELVQSNDPEILAKASELTAGAEDEFSAVQAILRYVVDNMKYVLMPQQFDAIFSFKNSIGNCQNYSHLTAALLRAVGIPVRIVTGITLKKAYDIETEKFRYCFEMAQGRHSWIEVYFPQMGWIPFDPQQTEFFVHNRYLRLEMGLDNDETGQDGLVRWSQCSGSASETPKVEEAYEANFVSDQIQVKCKQTLDTPQKLLLTPELLTLEKPFASVAPVVSMPAEETKPIVPQKPIVDFTKLSYTMPFEYGNLDYPRNFNFLLARLYGADIALAKGILKPNFIVETAEYVTGKQKFGQVFVLQEPIRLQQIRLALHNFGGDGTLWLELSEEIEGKPGETAETSKKIPLSVVKTGYGYDWVDFDFSQKGLILSPGRYWFVLKWSGNPIVNWFYTYGKPLGPIDGTRSCALDENDWERILSFEFNYDVVGLKTNEESE